jgi:hypothetical protein
MPIAFKGYPYRMKQAVKATVLILLVSLLSGCSSAEEKACEAAEVSRDTYNRKAGTLQAEAAGIVSNDLEKAFRKFDLENESKATYKLSLQVIITYKECFTPEQVVEAQRYLDNNK